MESGVVGVCSHAPGLIGLYQFVGLADGRLWVPTVIGYIERQRVTERHHNGAVSGEVETLCLWYFGREIAAWSERKRKSYLPNSGNYAKHKHTFKIQCFVCLLLDTRTDSFLLSTYLYISSSQNQRYTVTHVEGGRVKMADCVSTSMH